MPQVNLLSTKVVFTLWRGQNGVVWGCWMDVQPGDHLEVRTALNEWIRRRAVTSVETGYDFLVVWVCSEEEWAAAQNDGREPDADPWPADEVRQAEAAKS